MSKSFLQLQAGESGSHEAALAFVVVRVFETQSLFGPVLLQVRQLLAVDGAPAFPVEIHADVTHTAEHLHYVLSNFSKSYKFAVAVLFSVMFVCV